ncbi:hypothetical protein L3X38_036322 [Prunus dulcis]|uniref:Uncharacterized protein n=1 Tax=Prunus dulcis TaxID=3755 RepID=A0AAD4YPK0_PRUDU|nr:hypothetical protein L3X38_036322 [Prunus dulcis]
MDLNRTEELHLCCGCCDFTISRPGLGTHNTNPIKSRHNHLHCRRFWWCVFTLISWSCVVGTKCLVWFGFTRAGHFIGNSSVALSISTAAPSHPSSLHSDSEQPYGKPKIAKFQNQESAA